MPRTMHRTMDAFVDYFWYDDGTAYRREQDRQDRQDREDAQHDADLLQRAEELRFVDDGCPNCREDD